MNKCLQLYTIVYKNASCRFTNYDLSPYFTFQPKRQHNDEVMQKSYDNLQNKTVGILNKKNIFDKGSKMKLSRDSHDVVSSEGYNIKLDNDRTYPPKDIVVLKDRS